MKSRILGLLAVGLLAGPIAAQASFLYTFEGTGTSVSFTSPNILTSAVDPFTQVVGKTFGGVTITDAFFGPTSGSQYCVSFAGSGGSAFNCGRTGSSVVAVFESPVSVGAYSPITGGSGSGGFPNINRLTIAEVSAVPEPGAVALLSLGLAAACLSRRRKAH